MSGGETQKLRTQVRAFRSAVRELTDPAAGLLADLLGAEDLVNLTPAMPLLDLDLFGAVLGLGPSDRAIRASDEVRVRWDNAASGSDSSQPARSVTHQEELLPNEAPGSGHAAHQVPVFSFRKRGMVREMRENLTWPRAEQGRITSQESTTDTSIPQVAGSVEASGDTSVHVARSDTTLAQLAQFAEEVSRQMQPNREPNVLSIGLAAQTPHENLLTPAPRSPSQLERLINQALRLTSRGRGARSFREDASGRVLHEARPSLVPPLHEKDPWRPGAEIEASHEASSSHALPLINTYADHLLKSGMAERPTGALKAAQLGVAGALGTELGQPHVQDDYTSVAPLAEAGAGMARLTPPTQTQSGEPSLIESAFGRQMDAVSIAALVNEVLLEQARRHGVDLS